MSGTVTVRQSSVIVRDRDEGVLPDAGAIAEERGIEGVNRLMIEAAPSLVIPEELRSVIVPEPTEVWSMIMASTGRAYPFVPEATPTWERLMTEIRKAVTECVNSELRDTAVYLRTIQEQNMAHAQVMREANEYLRQQVEGLGRGLERVLECHHNPVTPETQVAASFLQTPVAFIPRWERTLQQAVRNHQYTLRSAPRPRARSRPTTQIQSAQERARAASRARARRDATQAEGRRGGFGLIETPEFPSFSQTRGNSDSDSDYQESVTGDDAARSGSENPFSSVFARRPLANLGTQDRPAMPLPNPPLQPSAALEMTQSLDEQERPRTAIGPEVETRASETTQATPRPERPVGLNDRDNWPQECGHCRRTGHSTIACPWCETCNTFGHDAASCRGCAQCRARHCRQKCRQCRARHTHLITCPEVAQTLGMAETSNEEDMPENLRHILRQMRQNVREQYQQPSGEGEGTSSRRTQRGTAGLGIGPAGGESSAAGAAGGNPPSPPPQITGARRSRSRSPRGNQRRQGASAPGGGPDPSDSSDDSGSSSSDSDADDESEGQVIQRLRKKLKSLEKKRRPHKPDRLDIRPFDGDADDLNRFVLDVESKFDYHRKALRKDMDKIRLIVPLLEGNAKKWYENIHVNINKHAAARQNVPFDKNSVYRKWNTVFKLFQASFGQRMTRDKSVLEWNRLRHREGQIDNFLDRIITLAYATGYSGDMVIDKVKEGLTDTMRASWAMVQNKPKDVSEYMAALRAFGHEIEHTANYTRSHNRSRGSGDAVEAAPKKEKKGRKEKRERKERASQPQSQSSTTKKVQSSFKDKETELKGIPEAVREERR